MSVPARNLVTRQILDEVLSERNRQDKTWGEQNHPLLKSEEAEYARNYFDRKAAEWKSVNASRVADGSLAWDGILLEEVFEAFAEIDPHEMRDELIQVAAVAVAIVECIDRRRNQND